MGQRRTHLVFGADPGMDPRTFTIISRYSTLPLNFQNLTSLTELHQIRDRFTITKLSISQPVKKFSKERNNLEYFSATHCQQEVYDRNSRSESDGWKWRFVGFGGFLKRIQLLWSSSHVKHKNLDISASGFLFVFNRSLVTLLTLKGLNSKILEYIKYIKCGGKTVNLYFIYLFLLLRPKSCFLYIGVFPPQSTLDLIQHSLKTIQLLLSRIQYLQCFSSLW